MAQMSVLHAGCVCVRAEVPSGCCFQQCLQVARRLKIEDLGRGGGVRLTKVSRGTGVPAEGASRRPCPRATAAAEPL